VAAELGIAKRCEIGVVGDPVKHLAEGCRDAQREQRAVHTPDFRKQRILECQTDRADDEQRLQPVAPGERENRWPKHEAAGKDARLRQERHRNRDAGAEEDHEEEDTAGALGQSLDAGMQVDAIDRVIAQKCHEKTDGKECGTAGSRAGQAAPFATS